eukprot:9962419-Alexandrium_andersonii.AAC.1
MFGRETAGSRPVKPIDMCLACTANDRGGCLVGVGSGQEGEADYHWLRLPQCHALRRLCQQPCS